ncbi:hypothetical protein CF166_16075 [Amycolatopsis sp. KNN50.9b]|nr:hypothetical protein CF166_16075 [Amycolatopsis sp. KNN50.9b]
MVSGSDRGSPATRAGVVVLDGPSARASTGRVSLVLATHHTVVAAAQHLAVRCHAPIVSPDRRYVSPGSLHLWLRPELALILTGPDARQEVVLRGLQLRDVADTEHPVLVDVFARPSGSGVLLGVTDGEGATVELCGGPRVVRASAPTAAVLDGITRTVAPGTYRIDLAHPPLYRLHAEPVARPETGCTPCPSPPSPSPATERADYSWGSDSGRLRRPGPGP